MKPTRVIEPRRPGLLERVREARRQWRLIPYFARRFNEKRYIRTWLGRSWLILRPALLVGSQAFVFSAVLSVPSGGAPYLVVFLVAFSSWHLFAETAYWSARSLELNRGALKRMYLPRLNIIVASVTPALVDVAILFTMLGVAIAWYAIADGAFYLTLGSETAAALAGLSLFTLLGLSIGLVLAVPGAQFRDVRFGLRFALNFWYFLSPVIYPLSAVPMEYRGVIELNPATAPIQLVKRGLIGQADVPIRSLAAYAVTTVVLASFGLWYFLRAEAAALDNP